MLHDPPTDLLLTVRDVADCLSISVRSVWRWTSEGKIPHPLRLGHRTARWKASEIQALIDRLQAEPPAN